MSKSDNNKDTKENKNNLSEVRENKNEIEEKLEETLNEKRRLKGFWAKLMFITGVLISLFHFYTAGFGVLLAMKQRAVHLMFLIPMAYIMFSFTNSRDSKVPIYDIVLALAGVGVNLYIILNYESIVRRAGLATNLDLIMSAITILLILEATRRAIGMALPIITAVFLIYGYFGPYMPGILAHRGFSLKRMLSHLYLTTEGIFGTPVGVSATFVFMFVLFGTFLQQTGIGEYLIDIVFSGLGTQSGGPAKAAVAASGLMGMVAGSSIANTVTTGSITIPIMKKMGFKPEVAGGVEVAASTNGQFLPPIMGAAAFLMVEYTGIPYLEIIKAAFIPAVLSYIAIFGIVHLQAKKTNMTGMKKADLKPFWPTFLRGSYFVVPILILIYQLVIVKVTPLNAAYYSILSIIFIGIGVKIFILYWCNKNSSNYDGKITKEDLPLAPTKESENGLFSIMDLINSFGKEFLFALKEAAENMIGIAMACASAGIIIGIVTLTGLGLRMTNLIITLSRGNILLALLFTMVASIILGLGLPTTAKYIILSTLTAPALVRLGIPLIAAHLFILYFGVLADDTPPVGLAAYAAAAVANSDPIKTGLLGFKFDMAAFILPYMFVFSPMLLMIDVSWYHLIWIIITAVLGMYAWSAGIQNYFLTKTNILERVGLLGFAILATMPSVRLDLLGLAGILGIYLFQRKKTNRPLIPKFGGAF